MSDKVNKNVDHTVIIKLDDRWYQYLNNRAYHSCLTIEEFIRETIGKYYTLPYGDEEGLPW